MTTPINLVLDPVQPFAVGRLTLRTFDDTGSPVDAKYTMYLAFSPRRVGAEGLDDAGRQLGTVWLSLLDSVGEVLIAGERLRLGPDLLRRHKADPRVPQGSLNVEASTEPDVEPTRGLVAATVRAGADVGGRVLLAYDPPPDSEPT